ncbi:hypothetical protein CEQ90_20475 [Lewinellaceae bacterium SD302]|nr:hypothetical protein CEQ90_20475 [Lewinellaceae bacterium SD302]
MFLSRFTVIIILSVVLISCLQEKTINVDTKSFEENINSLQSGKYLGSEEYRLYSNSIKSVEVTLPKSWRVVSYTDTILTIDNNFMDSVDEYIVASIQNLSYKELSGTGGLLLELNEAIESREDLKIEDVGNFTINNVEYNYVTTEDTSIVDQLGSNLMFNCIFKDSNNEVSYLVTSHTFGKYSDSLQVNMIRYLKSVNGFNVSAPSTFYLEDITNGNYSISTHDTIFCGYANSSHFEHDDWLSTINVIDSDKDTSYSMPNFSKLFSVNRLDENILFWILYVEGEVGPYLKLLTTTVELDLIDQKIISSCQGDEAYYNLSKSSYAGNGIFVERGISIEDSPKNESKLVKVSFENNIEISFNGVIKMRLIKSDTAFIQ